MRQAVAYSARRVNLDEDRTFNWLAFYDCFGGIGDCFYVIREACAVVTPKVSIQRICIRAKPKLTNPEYFEWQPATICIFVPENDKLLSVERSRSELERRHWDFISCESKSTLIEDRVREAGGEVWEAFQSAQNGELVFKVFPDHFGAGGKLTNRILPARITEQFMDNVVMDAGGRRPTTDEMKTGVKNADYIIGDFVFELKDLQGEGLEKREHQIKIANLFSSYFPEQREISIDPSILSKSDYLKYLDIVGAPIKTHIRKASKQIKGTKSLLGLPNLQGGIILLNTGFGSYPHEAFAEQVERYARKDSKEFFAVVSISIWSNTNGFDTYVFHRFSPEQPKQKEVSALRDAFNKRFTQMMTDLVQGGLSPRTEVSAPAKPVAFSCAGIDFAWVPPKMPLPQWG